MGSAFRYRPGDLRLPVRIYGLRKSAGRETPKQQALDEVVNTLSTGDSANVSTRLDELEH